MVKKILFLVVLVVLSATMVQAQVTTSSITGTVKSQSGENLQGATILAVHEPTGSKYTTVVNDAGQYTLPNLRVGGPYKISVTYIGYASKEFNDVYLQLGESYPLLFELSKSGTELETVTVSSTSRKNATAGPSTFVSRRELEALPTISRNINDFARLNPLASVRNNNSDGSPAGISFGGQSTRYNQFAIDGANSSDIFGLSANGTNGGQSGINPIPFESIQEVQVILAPYDVTQGGFTGGGMNAVTKSGTNTFHGSAYGMYQNQSWVGKSFDTRTNYADFTNSTYGFSLGGPIIKDKLFFFANYEGLKRSQPVANQPGSGGSNIRISALDSIRNYLMDETKHTGWSYDPGAYNGLTNDRTSNSVFARIDWNINSKNKLMIRNSYVEGGYFNISSSSSSMSFESYGYTQKNKTNSTVVELSSNISSQLSNMLRLTFTAVRDKREVGDPFPSVAISDNGATYRFGNEYSSHANSLKQNVFTLSDNFNIYKGQHTITLGTNNEFVQTDNVFLQGVHGDYSYSSLANFYNGVINQYQTTYSTKGGGDMANGKISAGQFGLYAQDNWKIKSNFDVTYGLRADIPVYFSKPDENTTFNSSSIATANNVKNNLPPKSRILLSPRVGFNWNVSGDGDTKIRGGFGLFTGRVPLVWVSNQYSNTGIASIKYTANAAAIVDQGIKFTPGNPYQGTPTTTPATEIDVTDRDFVAPRTFRANLALDQKLPWGLTGTIEGIFTKTIKDILYQDINLVDPTATVVNMGGDVNRPFYNMQRHNSAYTNVIYLTNTNKGYAYNVYVQLRKAFVRGWSGSIAYALGHSYGMHDGTSSTALSNMRFAYNVNGFNHLDLTRNNNDLGSRVSGYVAKEFKYANGRLGTKFGLFYSGYSGQAFSYIFYGNVNGDDNSSYNATTNRSSIGTNNASLMFVPTDASYFTTLGSGSSAVSPADQFAAWQTFVNGNPYLKDLEGKNTERNGDRMPWENHFDLKVTQDFYLINSHKVSVFVNIFNVGNLINKKWGASYYLANQSTSPLNFVGYAPTADANVYKAQYTFNSNFGNNKYTGKPWAYGDFGSRWNMQLGVSYSF